MDEHCYPTIEAVALKIHRMQKRHALSHVFLATDSPDPRVFEDILRDQYGIDFVQAFPDPSSRHTDEWCVTCWRTFQICRYSDIAVTPRSLLIDQAIAADNNAYGQWDPSAVEHSCFTRGALLSISRQFSFDCDSFYFATTRFNWPFANNFRFFRLHKGTENFL